MKHSILPKSAGYAAFSAIPAMDFVQGLVVVAHHDGRIAWVARWFVKGLTPHVEELLPAGKGVK